MIKLNNIPSFLLDSSSFAIKNNKHKGIRQSYLDKGIESFVNFINETYKQFDLSSKKGFLQDIDPRIKIGLFIIWIIVINLQNSIVSELYIYSALFILVVISKINIFEFYKKVLILGFFFGFIIALPSALNLITNGIIIIPFVHLEMPYQFWIYNIPSEIGITKEGIEICFILTIRVLNSLTLSFLMLYTTEFSNIIKSLKIFKIPDIFLVIISLTYKYIFIFADMISDMYNAKKIRTIQLAKDNKEARYWTTSRLAFILKKTQIKCDDIYNAMMARGFDGQIKLYNYQKIKNADWVKGFFLLAISILFLVV